MKLNRSLWLRIALAFVLFVPAALKAQDTNALQPLALSSLDLPAADDGLPGAGPINRKDWFVNLWKSRRIEWATKVQLDQHALVFLGDSITQGWKDLDKTFDSVRVANRGISGDTTRGVLIRLPQDVLALHPRGVVLLIGTNDLGMGTPPETIVGNVKLILAELKQSDAKLPIVLCEVMPSGDGPNRSAERIQALNKLYLEAVQNDPQVTVFDTYNLFADDKGNSKKDEFPDLLHPNQMGYQKWAAELRPVLTKLGLLETTAKKIVPPAGQASAAGPGFPLPPTDDGLPGEGLLRRGEWFQGVWTNRRSTFAERAKRDKNALVFIGDSITDSWKDDFGGTFQGIKVANRGINGDTTRGVLVRLQEIVDLDPKGAVVLIGTNDLNEKMEPEAVTRNLKLIIGGLKERNPQIPIVLCTVFPNIKVKEQGGDKDKIQELNKQYLAAVKGDPNITVIDTWKLFANEKGDTRVEEFPDGRHPNKLGYAKWAAALRPVLATLDFAETEPDKFQVEQGFTSLFNGKDLTGWGTRPNAEGQGETKSFDGKMTSDDGRYVAKNGRLIVMTPPEGRRVQALWTTREFPKDFVLKLEFRATPNADSGVFIRQPQLQCRDYALAGPYKTLRKYKPQDWNELVVTVKDGVAHCTCNGEMLEAALQVPATGPIGLEGDRGQLEYRRIRIKETP